jgi:hypothetical protein
MPGSPFSDRAVPFTFAERMSQVDVAEADHPDRGRLDHRQPVTGGINHSLPQAWAGQGLAFTLVIRQQPGRRGLAATEDRSDQLVAERPRKGELRNRQFFS